MRPLFLFALLAVRAFAHDELRITSPNGEIEVQVSVNLQGPDSFERLAYQISYQGKPLLSTSYMGYWIRFQEPILGENLGLMTAKTESGSGYNGVVGQYMQNGSLGKRINLEFRAYDDGVAFRYIIPRSTAIDQFAIMSEETEFHFAHDIQPPALSPLPLVLEQKGLAWIRFDEVPVEGLARMSLAAIAPNTLGVRLNVPKDVQPVDMNAPFTGSWRVLTIAATRSQADSSHLADRLR